MSQRDLESLTAEECLTLLRENQIGRLVYVDDLGPVAIPVNYAMVGEDLLLRVAGGAKQQAVDQPMLAFEVDHIDEEARSGWSVVVRGSGTEVPLQKVPDLFRSQGARSPTPWALGVHNVWVRLHPEVITGRRLGETGVSLSV